VCVFVFVCLCVVCVCVALLCFCVPRTLHTPRRRCPMHAYRA